MLDAKTALQQLAYDIKMEIMRRLHEYGYNKRAGRNTLVGSDLEKSIEVKVTGENTLAFQIADYYEYIVRG